MIIHDSIIFDLELEKSKKLNKLVSHNNSFFLLSLLISYIFIILIFL